jgi:IS30 family transposase
VRPRIRRELQRAFWGLIREGEATETAAERVGVSAMTGKRWFTDAGGMSPFSVASASGRFLSYAEREEIALGRAAGQGVREIARRMGRDHSTVSRELRRNRGSAQFGYRAWVAQGHADARARRPKPRRLQTNARLHAVVQGWLEQRCSPEQIRGRLRREFPDDPGMRISHEAIYQALYVQGRGGLRRELARCLRTGRAMRKPRRRVERRREVITNKVMISERPPEVADRAVPGHWEGDLIIGAHGASAIGTLVERTTRFTMLLHLPGGFHAEAVRDAITAKIVTLPAQLRRSLTWDQGFEMRRHTEITVATGLPIYFCDPSSPWQRGTNENTNGLLRQYFPKGTDLRRYSEFDLDMVADELNRRPRKTLDYATPAETLEQLLSNPETSTGGATDP